MIKKSSYIKSLKTLNINPINIGIIASRYYQDDLMIKNFINNLTTLENTVTVLGSGNNQGGDVIIKKYALNLELKYVEYNPYCTPHNTFSYGNAFLYNKKFSTKFLIARYLKLIEDADKIVVFAVEKEKDKLFLQVLKKLEKIGKPVGIIKN